jgi:preprotein translocase subunit SecG
MYTFLIVVHVLVSIILVAVVLLQVGRGRGMLGFLGGGTAETIFGSRAGDVLTKTTSVAAIVFMLTSLTLAYLSLQKTGSIAGKIKHRTVETPVGAEDVLATKGAEAVEKAKDKLMEKIPLLGGKKTDEEKSEEAKPAEKEMKITERTESRLISQDEKGNRIMDETKYDAEGKVKSHKEVVYDKKDKVILEKDLATKEAPASETPAK